MTVTVADCPGVVAGAEELVERIAAALGRDEPCQDLLVELASVTGWGQARRLLLARVCVAGDAAV